MISCMEANALPQILIACIYKISISCNHISDVGAMFFFGGALVHHHILLELDLECNAIGEEQLR